MYEIGLLPNKQRYGITKVIENSEAWKVYEKNTSHSTPASQGQH